MEVQRLLLNMSQDDIKRYTSEIAFNERYIYPDNNAKQDMHVKIWDGVSSFSLLFVGIICTANILHM